MKLKPGLMIYLLGLALVFMHVNVCTAANSWELKSPMPTARFFAKAEAIDGKIYVFGGQSGGSYVTAVEIYDTMNDTWSTGANMPAAIAAFATAAVDTKIYIIGGWPLRSTVSVYDTAADTWSTAAPLPIANRNIRAVNIDGLIYIFGGEGHGGGGTPRYKYVYRYNPISDSWSQLPDMPDERVTYGMAVLDGKVHIAGGISGPYDYQSIRTTTFLRCEDLEAGTYSYLAPLPEARSELAAEAHVDKLYIMAGLTEPGGVRTYSDETVIYSANDDSWTHGPSLNYGRWAPASAIVGNTIYIIGGRTQGEIDLSSIEALKLNNSPLANAGENQAIVTQEQPTTVLLGTATDADGDSLEYRWLEGSTVLSDWQAVGPDGAANLNLAEVPYFSIGEHTLTLEVCDGTETVSDEMILTVDNSAPSAQASGSGVYEIWSDITLSGEVSDYDGDQLSYAWIADGALVASGTVETIILGDPVALPDNVVSNLSLGVHVITLRVSDGINEPVDSTITVEIVDTTQPTLAPEPNKSILWPPNHQMEAIEILVNASDNSGEALLIAATVSSNEPIEGTGDGDTAPDWTEPVIDQANGIITLELRAERSGSGEGRVYTVTISVTDSSGNVSTADVDVSVPHSKGKK